MNIEQIKRMRTMAIANGNWKELKRLDMILKWNLEKRKRFDERLMAINLKIGDLGGYCIS